MNTETTANVTQDWVIVAQGGPHGREALFIGKRMVAGVYRDEVFSYKRNTVEKMITLSRAIYTAK